MKTRTIKQIPNTITSLNLFTGCIGIFFAFQGNYKVALVCMLLAAVFDFLDGFAARLLKAYSAIGKELDSLADVVSFGVLPGVMVFSVLSQSDMPAYLPFGAFIIPVFSALRLAKFNIDDRQTTSFIGLATPANAIFFGGATYSYTDFFIEQPWILSALALLFCALLVSELRMFSLKLKGFSWAKNKVQYIFLSGCIILFATMKLDAFSPIIAWYIVLSIISNFLWMEKKIEESAE